MKSAFRAYPSAVHGYYAADRSCALYADAVEFDQNGEFSVGACAFVASVPKTMFFHFNMLFIGVPAGTYLTALLFLRKAGDSVWKELCGTDIVCGTWIGGVAPQGVCISRLLQMQAGDAVQARPCFNGGSGSLALAQSLSGDGIATCNYFEGFEV